MLVCLRKKVKNIFQLERMKVCVGGEGGGVPQR